VLFYLFFFYTRLHFFWTRLVDLRRQEGSKIKHNLDRSIMSFHHHHHQGSLPKGSFCTDRCKKKNSTLYQHRTAFVDACYGNDSTAILEHAQHPFMNIQTAISAIQLLGKPSQKCPWLIQVAPGQYKSKIWLAEFIDIHGTTPNTVLLGPVSAKNVSLDGTTHLSNVSLETEKPNQAALKVNGGGDIVLTNVYIRTVAWPSQATLPIVSPILVRYGRLSMTTCRINMQLLGAGITLSSSSQDSVPRISIIYVAAGNGAGFAEAILSAVESVISLNNNNNNNNDGAHRIAVYHAGHRGNLVVLNSLAQTLLPMGEHNINCFRAQNGGMITANGAIHSIALHGNSLPPRILHAIANQHKSKINVAFDNVFVVSQVPVPVRTARAVTTGDFAQINNANYTGNIQGIAQLGIVNGDVGETSVLDARTDQTRSGERTNRNITVGVNGESLFAEIIPEDVGGVTALGPATDENDPDSDSLSLSGTLYTPKLSISQQRTFNVASVGSATTTLLASEEGPSFIFPDGTRHAVVTVPSEETVSLQYIDETDCCNNNGGSSSITMKKTAISSSPTIGWLVQKNLPFGSVPAGTQVFAFPASVRAGDTIFIEIGGGGGGGASYATPNQYGGGGGGGGAIQMYFQNYVPGDLLTVNSFGLGGQPGNAGGTTQILFKGRTLTAQGGEGGTYEKGGDGGGATVTPLLPVTGGLGGVLQAPPNNNGQLGQRRTSGSIYMGGGSGGGAPGTSTVPAGYGGTPASLLTTLFGVPVLVPKAEAGGRGDGLNGGGGGGRGFIRLTAGNGANLVMRHAPPDSNSGGGGGNIQSPNGGRGGDGYIYWQVTQRG
jgi:hypothetical protein